MDGKYYIYIIKCSGDRLYTGYTSDPEKRFNEHKTGKRGAKFTRGFIPLSIEAIWEIIGSKGDAMRVEAFIKSLKKMDKIRIIESPVTLVEIISDPFRRLTFGYQKSSLFLCDSSAGFKAFIKHSYLYKNLNSFWRRI